jgi:hypothetical protein
MGSCSSKEKTINLKFNINIYVFTEKINHTSQSLKDLYISSGNFSNTYHPLNHGYLIVLKKFARKVDPFMHYRGKSIKKKEKLRNNRHIKNKDDIFLLIKTWELYLISQRLSDWGDLSHIKNKNNVLETIELFLKKREEIIELLI